MRRRAWLGIAAMACHSPKATVVVRDAGQAAPSEERIAADVATLVGFETRNTCSTTIAGARDFVRKRFDSEGLTTALDSFDTPCTPPSARESVVGVLRGRDPKRLVMLGAHYDSRSTERNDPVMPAPGANDSGSQTALLLEVSRLLAGQTFEASIAFVAFAGEEQGLLGSKSVASHLATLFPGATLEAMLNCDIVGGDVDANDAATLRQFRLYAPGAPRETRADVPDGTTDSTSPARGLQRYVAATTAALGSSMTMIPKLREDRPGRGGDHTSFIELGLPAVRFIEANETLSHQHSSEDTLAHMTPAYTARMTQVVAAALTSLARAPVAPTNLVVTKSGAGKVTVAWKSGADHAVLWLRAASSQDPSQRVVVTGDHAEVTAPPAPFFVTVSAADTAGHESLAAWPEWRCDDKACAQPVTAADVLRKL